MFTRRGAGRVVSAAVAAGIAGAESFVPNTPVIWVLRRRTARPPPEVIGIFGAAEEAAAAIDEQVGQGHGEESDFEVVTVRTRPHVIVPVLVGVTAFLAVAISTGHFPNPLVILVLAGGAAAAASFGVWVLLKRFYRRKHFPNASSVSTG